MDLEQPALAVRVGVDQVGGFAEGFVSGADRAGDGYYLSLVEAEEGYKGDPHVHASTEFLFVVDGALRNQGRVMTAHDGYVAATGSTHDDFEVGPGGATYLSICKI